MWLWLGLDEAERREAVKMSLGCPPATGLSGQVLRGRWGDNWLIIATEVKDGLEGGGSQEKGSGFWAVPSPPPTPPQEGCKTRGLFL